MRDLRLFGGGTSKIHEMNCKHDLNEYLSKVTDRKANIIFRRNTGYLNIPCAFDIESTSTYVDGKKFAFMYIWQASIDDLYMMGRTWQEFETFCEALSDCLNLSENMRLVFYIHNMSFEYQFLRKHFEWVEVFSRDMRKPIKAVTKLGIEFKDSYALTNKSLEAVGEDLKNPVLKAVGDLDYNLVRTPATPLTDAELGYCINDIRIVTELIREKIASDGSITKIPLTLTGYVREYTREYCLKPHFRNKDKRKRDGYYSLMRQLRLSGPDEYKMLKRAFCGGYCHASALNAGKVFENVTSYDITSSYPTILLTEKLPMSTGWPARVKSEQQFRTLLKSYACVFDVCLYGVRPKRIECENYISASKCFQRKGVIENNGRIAYADMIKLTVTEIDFAIIERVYDLDGYAVGDMICYRKGYLPKSFIECTLHFYENKTTLKGVEGQEDEYMRLKGMLNSLYGMIVTDIAKNEICYTNNEGWYEKEIDLSDTLERYNNSRKRFLFYPWGVYITAYARRNLFNAINECGPDYVYSDTDSVKLLHKERHEAFFELYNQNVIKKIERTLRHYGIDARRARPKDKNGIEHPLGVYCDEGTYKRFKTIGAKRYIVEYAGGGYKLTVAGLSKKDALKYIVENYVDPVEALSDDLIIPQDGTGKLTHTYIDEAQHATICDYAGNGMDVFELSGVHLEKAEYDFSMQDAYIKFLNDYADMWRVNNHE